MGDVLTVSDFIHMLEKIRDAAPGNGDASVQVAHGATGEPDLEARWDDGGDEFNPVRTLRTVLIT